MPESTIELVKKLTVQLKCFKELSEGFGHPLQGTDLRFSAELSYLRLRFNIKQSETLYFEYTVWQEGSGMGKPEPYCHDRESADDLKKHFESFPADLAKISTDTPDVHSVTHIGYLDRYLAVAESIAAHGYLCSRGDDYRPGYFSKITIDAERIRLEQVNHMNSRSLDHKDNYSMRDLEFDIPLSAQSMAPKHSIGHKEHDIGVMRVRFSDRSSKTNRACGDRILEAIEAEKLRFTTSET